MNKKETILSIIASILVIVDILIKYIPITKLKFLTTPIISINVLEIIILIFIITIIYIFLPNFFLKNRNRKRAEEFFLNWKKFKDILQRYFQSGDENLQKDYEVIKEKLNVDFNYFAEEIKKISDSTHRSYNDIAISNFEQTFSPRLIKEWHGKINRRVPEEFDCFDYIPLSLMGHYSH